MKSETTTFTYILVSSLLEFSKKTVAPANVVQRTRLGIFAITNGKEYQTLYIQQTSNSMTILHSLQLFSNLEVTQVLLKG